MFIIIDIYSKNYKFLNNFLHKFFNQEICNKLKLIILKTNLQKTKKTFFLTVLKSPHVNKTAQEQFGYKMYKHQIKCFTFQPFLFLLFLKKIKFFLFSEITVKVNVIKNTTNSKKKLKNVFNVDNYSLDFNELKLIDYLNFFEIYGEFVINSKVCLDSSVG